MKLYFSPGSCSLSPHIALRETGLDFELVQVDTKTHTYNQGEDYYKINELGYVPALQIAEGLVLREGAVLIQYISDLAPKSGLAPANGTLERYQLQELLSFLTSEIHKGFIPLFYQKDAGEYFEIVKINLLKRFNWIDRQLAERQFVMGDKFSIADGYLFALTGWAQADWMVSIYNLDLDLSHFENLASWYKRILKRPSVQACMKAEGLAFLFD